MEYPTASSEAVSRVLRSNRKTDTRPELRLRSDLGVVDLEGGSLEERSESDIGYRSLCRMKPAET